MTREQNNFLFECYKWIITIALYVFVVTSCNTFKQAQPNTVAAQISAPTIYYYNGMNITFQSTNESGYFMYVIERSTDQKNWSNVISFKPNGRASTYSKSWNDTGAGYYRVKIGLTTGGFIPGSKIIYVR